MLRLGFLCLALSVHAQDASIASSMAKAAAHLAAAGKTEKAKNMLLQVLADDPNNPLALLELSKLSTDGAGDLCWQAYLSAQKAAKPDAILKVDIIRQMAKVNPAGAKLIQALDAHATSLSEIGKRYKDALTAEELSERGVKTVMASALPRSMTKENMAGRYKYQQPGYSGEIELFADGTQTNTYGVKKSEYHWEIKDGELVMRFVTSVFTFQPRADGTLAEKKEGWKIEKIPKKK